MATLKFFMIEIEGDEATCQQALSVAMERFLPKRTAPALPPPERRREGAGSTGPPPSEPVAVDPPEPSVDSPRRREDAKTSGARRRGIELVCEQVPGRTFTVKEAAALANCKPSSIYAAVSPSSRTEGRIGGYTFHYAPEVEEAAEQPTAPIESRPRGNGESMPLNPNRVGAGAPSYGDPAPSHGGGWRPRKAMPHV